MQYQQTNPHTILVFGATGHQGRGLETVSDAMTIKAMAAVFSEITNQKVEHTQISWEDEKEMAGEEVMLLSRWVERDGPRVDINARRRKYP